MIVKNDLIFVLNIKLNFYCKLNNIKIIMAQEVLEQIMIKYPYLKFGYNCDDCNQHGYETSKDMYLCINCCNNISNNFQYYNDNRKEIFLVSREFIRIKVILEFFLMSNTIENIDVV